MIGPMGANRNRERFIENRTPHMARPRKGEEKHRSASLRFRVKETVDVPAAFARAVARGVNC